MRQVVYAKTSRQKCTDVLISFFICWNQDYDVLERERERERERVRDRQTARQTDRQTDRQTETERQRQRDRDRERLHHNSQCFFVYCKQTI